MSSYRSYQQIIKLNSNVNITNNKTIKISNGLESVTGAECSSHNHVAKEKKKITRTKTGCFCCRKRKKKCDEKKPSCSGCLRNNLQCVYPTEEELTKVSTRKVKKSTKIVDLPVTRPNSPHLAACEMSPSTPALHNSDVESPIMSPLASPMLQGFQYITLKNSDLNDKNVPFLNISANEEFKTKSILPMDASKTRTQIPIKSLLN